MSDSNRERGRSVKKGQLVSLTTFVDEERDLISELRGYEHTVEHDADRFSISGFPLVQHLLDSMRRFGVQPLHDLAQTQNQELPPPGNTESSEERKPLVN